MSCINQNLVKRINGKNCINNFYKYPAIFIFLFISYNYILEKNNQSEKLELKKNLAILYFQQIMNDALFLQLSIFRYIQPLNPKDTYLVQIPTFPCVADKMDLWNIYVIQIKMNSTSETGLSIKTIW